jgi:hypothetical protein
MPVKMVRKTDVKTVDPVKPDYMVVIGHSFWFLCPGCQEARRFTVRTDGGSPSWTFDGNVKIPSFSPSLRIYTTDPETKEQATLCHLFVRNGQIEYCGDCPHPPRRQNNPAAEYSPGSLAPPQRLSKYSLTIPRRPVVIIVN